MHDVGVLAVVGIGAGLAVDVVLALVVAQVGPVVDFDQSVHGCLVALFAPGNNLFTSLAAFSCQKVPCFASTGPKTIHKHLGCLAVTFADHVTFIVFMDLQKVAAAGSTGLFIGARNATNNCCFAAPADFT